MTEPKPGFVAPDPRRIATRRDFGVELTLARRRRGLSIRSVARAIGVPVSTVGGYFAGSHLPALHPPDLLSQLLRVLGIDDEDEITLWWQAYWRVRGPVGEQSGSAPVDGGSPLAQVSVSIEAPIERLMVEPVLRGREVELKSLCDLVAQANQMHPEPRVRVLYGLGGSGKSTLALAVAQCARACGIRTFWVASDDRATTAAGMRALAVEIRVPVERLRAGSLPDAVWQRLRDLPEPWLLVFDNADNPLESLALPGQRVTDGTGWLRPVGTGLGTVIVTTRDGHRATWGDPAPSWLALHRLTGLADAHGAQVLMELAGESAGTVEEARVLSRRLGGLPLALMLAGRYLAEAGRTPPELALPRTYREYLAALETGDYADLFPAESEPARRAIGPTWDLSLDLVAGRAGGHAQSLLRLIAALGPGPIPHRELLDVRIMRDTPIFAGITPRLLWEALRALEALGMITIFSRAFPGERTSRVYIDIHPLVRHVTRHDRQMGEHLAEYAATATRLLHAAVHDHEPKSPSTWRLWHLMVGHCVAVLDLVADHKVDLAVVRAAVERASLSLAFCGC
jgi:Helix-turn-helix.